MARKPKTPKEPGTGRLAQMRQAYSMTAKHDKRLPLVLAGVVLGVFLVFLALGFALGNPWTLAILGVPTSILAGMFVFSRRVEKAAFGSIEGQPGAAAAVLNSLRRGWTVTPAVAVTRNQDLVHRVTGRPGVVLVAEGRPAGATNLLLNERKRTARVLGDAPVHEILVGDEEGQVPLKKLSRTVMRLPRALQPAEVTELNRRMKALDSQRGQLPIPKGPLPKGARMPKAPKA